MFSMFLSSNWNMPVSLGELKQAVEIHACWLIFLQVHLTQFFSLAKVKLWNTHKKNLPNFSVSDTFQGLKN